MCVVSKSITLYIQETYDNSVHNLTAVFQIADTILSGELISRIESSPLDDSLSVDQPIQYLRSTNRSARMMAERPMLNFTLAMVDAATKIYQKKYASLEILVMISHSHSLFSEVVQFTSTIAHHHNSRGEAGPVFYRLILFVSC